MKGYNVENLHRTLRQQNKGIRRLRHKVKMYRDEVKETEKFYTYRLNEAYTKINTLKELPNGKKFKELEEEIDRLKEQIVWQKCKLRKYEEIEKENQILLVRNIELCKTNNLLKDHIAKIGNRKDR